MSKKRVLIALPLAADLLTEIERSCEVVLAGGKLEVPGKEDFLAALPGVRGVLTTMRSSYDAGLFARFPELKVVSNFAVGYDNVDVEAATAAGVLVCNTPGVLDKAVSDLTLGLIIALSRNMLKNDRFVRSGAWMKGGAPLAQDISGKTLGLIGMGRIGATVAAAAIALGMRVIYYKPTRDQAIEARLGIAYRARDEVFAEADFVSVHTRLDATSRNSIGAREFSLMKPTAYFINTSRGGVVVEDELIAALRGDTIAGAGLDVMVTEPLPPESPLCSMDNVILQPHAGSATVQTRRAMIELAARNLIAAMRGERPQAMVNPEVWSPDLVR